LMRNEPKVKACLLTPEAIDVPKSAPYSALPPTITSNKSRNPRSHTKHCAPNSRCRNCKSDTGASVTLHMQCDPPYLAKRDATSGGAEDGISKARPMKVMDMQLFDGRSVEIAILIVRDEKCVESQVGARHNDTQQQQGVERSEAYAVRRRIRHPNSVKRFPARLVRRNICRVQGGQGKICFFQEWWL
jgi:hypothetical protein